VANLCCAALLTAADGQAQQCGSRMAVREFAWCDYSPVNESGDRQILLSLTAVLKYLAWTLLVNTEMVAPRVIIGSVWLWMARLKPKELYSAAETPNSANRLF